MTPNAASLARATSALARPPQYTPLSQYGTIGNCRTVALVSTLGLIDWPRLSQHQLIRTAECVRGRVKLTSVYEPRPDYGRVVARLELRGKLVYGEGLSTVHRFGETAPMPQ